ncbi:hypothetical protein LCGC14_2349030 [marine sediment metagenome]|uniref:Uncharacterized protein n=1 Tax=marine sediment metagenome TaxID=412755 RepID=A0A0F9F4T0_9ZZZZ
MTSDEALRDAILGPRVNAPITGLDRPHEANVKHHFLECELKTADDLIDEYVWYVRDGREAGDADAYQKLIWLLERLQESVL